MANVITIDTSFNFPAASNPRSACKQSGTDYILVTAANNNLYQFNTAGANTGTWTFSGAGGIITPFASGACAVSVDTSNNIVYLADLTASGTVGSITGTSGTIYTNNTHPSNSVFAVYDDIKTVYYPHSNGVSKLNKFMWSNTGGVWSLTTQTIDGMSNATGSKTTAVKKMANGNMLVGTAKGQLFEISPSTLRIVGEMSLPLDYPLIYRDDQSTSGQNASVIDIHANGNHYYIATSVGILYVVHWPTKSVIHTQPMRGSLNDNVLCDLASSVYFYGWSATAASGGVLTASNIATVYPKISDMFYCNDTATVLRAGSLCGASDQKFFVVYDALTSPSTVRGSIFSIQASGLPVTAEVTTNLIDGAAVAGRVIRIIDEPGSAYVYNDTPVSAEGESGLVPTGANVLEFAVYGSGVNERASLSTYQT